MLARLINATIDAVFRPPTDKVNDLELVTIIERDRRPSVSGNDIAVEFDGYSICFHPEGLYKRRERERRGGVEFSFFPVNSKFHSALRRMNFLVAVRPSKLACTSNDESGKEASSTSILISAAPPESATACV